MITKNFSPGSCLLAFLLAAALTTALPQDSDEKPFALVEGGRPVSEIVIAKSPPRSVKLAAKELQHYLEKITGAKLPVVTAPSPDVPAHVYVGQSAHTDALNISHENPPDGGFRMITGDHWLALIGSDRDFVPPEPYARNAAQVKDPQRLAEWDKLTGSTWGNPVGNPMYRKYSKALDLWAQDERGSLNAVYAFLRSLGVEWYMEGGLGEIVPSTPTITVSPMNKTVTPDFGLRYHHGFTFGHNRVDAILWYLRMGFNNVSKRTGEALVAMSHGMRDVFSRPEMKEKHPEFYALRGGKRVTELNQPDLSSEGLFQEHVKYVRFMFDHYDLPMLSIMPEDGLVYSEDPVSKARSTPGRGWHGSQSDYVWGYVNRVAQEVYKTHPDRLVSCFAYANYALPPKKIGKLSPNLVVGLLQYRFSSDPEKRRKHLEQRKAWRAKLGSDEPFLIWTHYPFNTPGKGANGIPDYFPHRIAEDLRSLKGISSGEIVEIPFDPKTVCGLYAPGFNHLNSYVTARLYWDADQDIDKLLEKYYTRFYGPARNGMKAFIEYCEANWEDLKKDAGKINEVFCLMKEARAQAPDGSPYARRIDLVAQYIKPLQALAEQLARGRENVPELRIDERRNAKIQIDGLLDEKEWQNLPGVSGLVNVETGARAKNPTSFRMFWGDDALYVGIRCLDRDMANLVISGNAHDDRSVWDGDNIEVMIETNAHSWYQLTINPAGELIDLDRAGGINAAWSSAAQVATTRDDKGWTVEIRIPVAPPDHGDPLHVMAGTKPTPTYPWYFNICRMRPRGETKELTAFSPTGQPNFQDIMKFAELHTGIKPERLEKLREKKPEKSKSEKH